MQLFLFLSTLQIESEDIKCMSQKIWGLSKLLICVLLDTIHIIDLIYYRNATGFLKDGDPTFVYLPLRRFNRPSASLLFHTRQLEIQTLFGISSSFTTFPSLHPTPPSLSDF